MRSRLDQRSRIGRQSRTGRHRAAAAASGGVDLAAVVAWDHAYWADGAEFNALGLADGATVTSWPDEITTSAIALTGGGTPLVRASDAAFNNERTIALDLGDSLVQATTMTACRSFVAVARLATANRWHDNQASGGGGRFVMGQLSDFQLYLGSTAYNSAYPATTAAHLQVVHSNGFTLTYLEVNGDRRQPGYSGTSTMSRANIIGNVDLAFVGFYAGEVSADPGWADFKTAVASKYDITMVT